MTLYRKKYRTETNRLRDHQYKCGTYFVTICTKKKMQWFGEIKDHGMVLSDIGKIVESEWIKSPEIRPYVSLDTWCVMPNHIHGIIVIDNVETSRGDVSLSTSSRVLGSETRANTLGSETRAPRVSTEASLQNKPSKKLELKSKTLGCIINQFKGAVTKQIRAAGFGEFQWQPRYHDRIIRSEKELAIVKNYITSNPDTWDKETIPWHADAAFYSS